MARSLPEAVRLFTVAGRSVPVRLTRSARRSVGLRIGPDGLAVTLPNRFPLYELDAVLQRKADWIVAKLDELAARPRAEPLADGAAVDWLGEPHAVRLGYLRGEVTADELRLATADPAALPQALEKLMRREARAFLAERLALWAGRLGLQYSAFKLTSAGTRWGSCTSAGAIRLHWRLMQAPLPVLDYVVIHELCHLVELNHSARFWALVASVCPDWKHKRDWLKCEGGRYFAW
ncbi:M48 family metallopeptidase [Chitinimonas koreensis]|uniref:M48 family metallopeptidase n=1 Tax=Chitinimonas koreensis TaxID=356302 RepID=UPI0003FC704B|nr:SprT family zinc-dependent metalloprotease [Chitinimonas koreensis]